MSFSRPQIPRRREQRCEFVDRHLVTLWKGQLRTIQGPAASVHYCTCRRGSVNMWRQFSFHYPSIYRRQGGTWTGRSWTAERSADPAFTLDTARTMGFSILLDCGEGRELRLRCFEMSFQSCVFCWSWVFCHYIIIDITITSYWVVTFS